MFSLVVILLVVSNVRCKQIHHDEICGGFDGRRLYLELGEHGTLLARNQSREKGLDISTNDTKRRQCSLEMVTCPSCVISVQFSFLNVSPNCEKTATSGSCGCDYVWVFEHPYEDVSGKKFCGKFLSTDNNTLSYKSKTRTTTIRFFYSSRYDHAFSLKYFSESNRLFIDGFPKLGAKIEQQFLTSPFFPQYYPRDLSVEYIINCKTMDVCKIRLIFTDFQVSRSSLIEFFDWNGRRIFVTTGSLFRPPVLITSGPALVVRFYANGGTNVGFKAKYQFFLSEDTIANKKTNTDCGGFVDNLGGGITMMQMVEQGTKQFDCYWLIKPPQNYLHWKTHIYVKVTKFENFVENTELVIRQGLTSNEVIVENLTFPLFDVNLKENVVSINEGFYVSLTGEFFPESKLEIVYAAFNYKDCMVGSEFLCGNQRCISTHLQCDGFDQCGDGTDEAENCVREHQGGGFEHIPNFYFPNNDRFFDLKTATIVFVISSLALIVLITSLIILLYRINVRGNNRRTLQSHLQTINDLLEEGSSRVEEEEIIIVDDPPTYEAPPDYTELMKTAFDSDLNLIRTLSMRKSITEKFLRRSCSVCNSEPNGDSSATGQIATVSDLNVPSERANCQTIPDSPPPTYAISCISNVRNQTPSQNEGAKSAADGEGPQNLGPGIFSRWLRKDNAGTDMSKYRFSSNFFVNCERFKFLSYFPTPNREHCLSDSDLSSLKCFAGETTSNKFPRRKITRSVSIENLFTV